MAMLKLSAAEDVVSNSNIPDAEKAALRGELRQSVASLPDNWIYRIVVIALGLAIFVPLVPVLLRDRETAQMLLPIATGALGALAGLLAPSPAADG